MAGNFLRIIGTSNSKNPQIELGQIEMMTEKERTETCPDSTIRLWIILRRDADPGII